MTTDRELLKEALHSLPDHYVKLRNEIRAHLAAPPVTVQGKAITTGGVRTLSRNYQLAPGEHNLGCEIRFSEKRLEDYTSAAVKMFSSVAGVANEIHYPECWDTVNYPTLESALSEVYAHFQCQDHPSQPVTVEPVVRSYEVESIADAHGHRLRITFRNYLEAAACLESMPGSTMYALGRILPAEPRRVMTLKDATLLRRVAWICQVSGNLEEKKRLIDLADAIPASPDATDTGSQE